MASQPPVYYPSASSAGVAATSSSASSISVSTQDAIKTIQTALLLTSGTINHASARSSPAVGTPAAANSEGRPRLLHNPSSSSSNATGAAADSPYSVGAGTPTHSEIEASSQPTQAPPTTAVSGRATTSLAAAAAVVNSHHQHHNQNSGGGGSGGGTLSNLVSSSPLTALKPQPPSLTPSLSRLYRESLITHVVGWPAEAVERAAQRVNDDHNGISNLGITRVSAELKMARSLVRLAEIQATVQEQRILFLRQQSLDLEALRSRPASAAASSSAALQVAKAHQVEQQQATSSIGGQHHHQQPGHAVNNY